MNRNKKFLREFTKMQVKAVCVIFSIFLVSACSSESSSNRVGETAYDGFEEETLSDSADEPTETSTLLADNRVSSDTSFSNFRNQAIVINPAEYPMNGSKRFLKLVDEQGQILFLGEISANSPFSMTASVRQSTQILNLELFSESELDQTKVLEIEL